MSAAGTEGDAAGAAGMGGSTGTDGGALPTEFYACQRENPRNIEPCEVALEAFTRSPDRGPYCPPARADAPAALCAYGRSVSSGSCGELYVFRADLEGVDGTNCVYDTGGQLVGAEWIPDSHPRHYAGVAVPRDCALPDNPCAAPDAGP